MAEWRPVSEMRSSGIDQHLTLSDTLCLEDVAIVAVNGDRVVETHACDAPRGRRSEDAQRQQNCHRCSRPRTSCIPDLTMWVDMHATDAVTSNVNIAVPAPLAAVARTATSGEDEMTSSHDQQVNLFGLSCR